MHQATNTHERILVCVSPAPSNQTVIAAAVKLAEAFHAALTAIYIKPTSYDSMSDKDRARLQNNIRFAEQHGASVATIVGNDVPAQIAEYAHISGTTKIVLGRSGAPKRFFWNKPTLTEQVILNAPDIDVYIIPDSSVDLKHKRQRDHLADRIRPTWKDTLITVLLLLAAILIGLLFDRVGFSEANIITVFILSVLIISVMTVSPLYGILGSLACVLLFNWFFIKPRFSFHTYEPEYAVTFGIMLIASLITGTLANKLKENARQSAREAYRVKVLLDTNQLLQKADSARAVLQITADQIISLLDCPVTVYPLSPGGNIGTGLRFYPRDSEARDEAPGKKELEIAAWVAANRQSAGRRMEKYGSDSAQYHPICMGENCYGVISVRLDGKAPESFVYSMTLSILGQAALALDNLRNAAEKEKATLIARNEQLRSNLLRSISHDIRTPLTSISGNASNLLARDQQLDPQTRRQIFSDISDDAEWLIGLVENLLSISRIENGRMKLSLSTEVMNDVLTEAIRHVDRNAKDHSLSLQNSDEPLLVRMDARLIMQVLINLINNAVKYTQPGSEIRVRCEKQQKAACVSVCDNGPGIPDEMKAHVFELFYTGSGMVSDGRRGLGLGLPLCKSIIEAHHGVLTLADNRPTGCCFSFCLPLEEVEIHE